jgi:hypothetical protein
MAKPIADSTNVSPGKAWAQGFSLITKADGSFADHEQLALDSRNRFGVRAECVHVRAHHELLDGGDCFGNVAQGE